MSLECFQDGAVLRNLPVHGQQSRRCCPALICERVYEPRLGRGTLPVVRPRALILGRLVLDELVRHGSRSAGFIASEVDLAEPNSFFRGHARMMRLDLDKVRQVEEAPERTAGNAVIEHFMIWLPGLAALNRQHVLFRRDGHESHRCARCCTAGNCPVQTTGWTYRAGRICGRSRLLNARRR